MPSAFASFLIYSIAFQIDDVYKEVLKTAEETKNTVIE